jgi:predicted PurR-regulated permease PerM
MVAASLVIVVAGLREIKPIVLPLVVACLLSVLSSPLLGWLIVRRVPKFISVLVTVLSNVAVLVVLLLLVGGSLRAFSNTLPVYQERLETKARDTFNWLELRGINTSEFNWLREGSLDDATLGPLSTESPTDPPVDNPGLGLINIASLVDVLASTLRGLASLMAMAFLIFVMMVFILFEASGFPHRLELALGWEKKELRRMWRAKREIQHYLGIKTIISLATGTLIYLWVVFMGVEFPLLWGLIAFLLNYIPSLGSIIASIPATVITLIETGPGKALLVLLGYLLVNVVFGNVIEPHLMGRQFGISTLVVFLSLVFWGWVWGPVGMLLSVPLTMILKIMLEHTEDMRWIAQLISANPVALERDAR